jgi:hypothetical protein
MYDTMVTTEGACPPPVQSVMLQVTAPDCTMTMDEFSEDPDGNKYNDCGGYMTACAFFVSFQVLVLYAPHKTTH